MTGHSEVILGQSPDLAHCKIALARLSDLVSKYSEIYSVCMVDFITKDIFSQVLNKDIQIELMKLDEEGIKGLPERLINIKEQFNPNSPLDSVLREISDHTLETLEVTGTSAFNGKIEKVFLILLRCVCVENCIKSVNQFRELSLNVTRYFYESRHFLLPNQTC